MHGRNVGNTGKKTGSLTAAQAGFHETANHVHRAALRLNAVKGSKQTQWLCAFA
jgi:hypothetical protein